MISLNTKSNAGLSLKRLCGHMYTTLWGSTDGVKWGRNVTNLSPISWWERSKLISSRLADRLVCPEGILFYPRVRQICLREGCYGTAASKLEDRLEQSSGPPYHESLRSLARHFNVGYTHLSSSKPGFDFKSRRSSILVASQASESSERRRIGCSYQMPCPPNSTA